MKMLPVIAYYDHYHDLSGGEISLHRVLTRIDRNKFSPLFIYHREGPFIEKVKSLGFPLVKLEVGDAILDVKRNNFLFQGIAVLFDAVKTILSLRKVLLKNGVSILHTNTLKSNLLGGIAALGRVKCIWHQRDILRGGVGKIYWVLAWLIPSKVISISESVKKSLPGHKSEVIYNGIPEDFGKERVRATRNGVVVTMIGRIAEWKNQEVLIRAASKLDCEVRIAGIPMFRGDDKYLIKLKSMAPQNVKFLGYVDTEAEYLSSDIAVHASKEPEPFGLIVAEAMACKLPVVASNLGAPKEILGKSGIFFDPFNSEELADKLQRLIGNPELRDKLGEEGYHRFKQYFTVEKEAQLIQELYLNILNENV